MRHDLRGLRGDNLAHILSLIGLAALTPGTTRVGWSNERHAYLESEESPEALNTAIQDGFRRMREDHRALIDVEMTVSGITRPQKKKQGKKGRPQAEDGEGDDKSGLPVRAISMQLDQLSRSARETAPSVMCIAGSPDGLLQKTRAQLGKTWFCRHVAHDYMQLDKLKTRPAVLTELSDSALMAQTTTYMPGGSRAGTSFDHIGSAVNIGINQSLIGQNRRPHPYIELLAIEGMKAMPAFPTGFGNPLNRGMERRSERGRSKDAIWDIPLWTVPLGYFEIEDFLAASNGAEAHRRSILEVRRFEIVENGKLLMLRPMGTVSIPSRERAQ